MALELEGMAVLVLFPSLLTSVPMSSTITSLGVARACLRACVQGKERERAREERGKLGGAGGREGEGGLYLADENDGSKGVDEDDGGGARMCRSLRLFLGRAQGRGAGRTPTEQW